MCQSHVTLNGTNTGAWKYCESAHWALNWVLIKVESRGQRGLFIEWYTWQKHWHWSDINSSPPTAAYMRQQTGSALVQIMACCLFGAKPSPEPMLSIGPLETNFSEIEVKIQNFSFIKCIWTCHLRKWRPFCPGEMSRHNHYGYWPRIIWQRHLYPRVSITVTGAVWRLKPPATLMFAQHLSHAKAPKLHIIGCVRGESTGDNYERSQQYIRVITTSPRSNASNVTSKSIWDFCFCFFFVLFCVFVVVVVVCLVVLFLLLHLHLFLFCWCCCWCCCCCCNQT